MTLQVPWTINDASWAAKQTVTLSLCGLQERAWEHLLTRCYQKPYDEPIINSRNVGNFRGH